MTSTFTRLCIVCCVFIAHYTYTAYCYIAESTYDSTRYELRLVCVRARLRACTSLLLGIFLNSSASLPPPVGLLNAISDLNCLPGDRHWTGGPAGADDDSSFNDEDAKASAVASTKILPYTDSRMLSRVGL